MGSMLCVNVFSFSLLTFTFIMLRVIGPAYNTIA